jgi:hypothetical protein
MCAAAAHAAIVERNDIKLGLNRRVATPLASSPAS